MFTDFKLQPPCALFLLLVVACGKPKSQHKPILASPAGTTTTAALTPRTLPKEVADSAAPVAPASSVVPAAVNDPAVFEVPFRGSCPNCSFAEQLAASRQRAESLHAKRMGGLIVEKSQVGVEVYKKESADGAEERLIHIVSPGFDPWEFNGFEGSEATRCDLGSFPKAPTLFELNLSQCPTGNCGGGCGPFRTGVSLLFLASHGKVTLVPQGNRDERDKVSDVDHDGTLEFSYPSPVVTWGDCNAAWCCSEVDGPRIFRYVGWDGSAFREDLPRLRRFYESQQKVASEGLAELRASQQRDASLRCELAKRGTELFWLGQLLGSERSALTKQWHADLRGFKPADCFSQPSGTEPDLATLARSRNDFDAMVLDARLNALFPLESSPSQGDSGVP